MVFAEFGVGQSIVVSLASVVLTLDVINLCYTSAEIVYPRYQDKKNFELEFLLKQELRRFAKNVEDDPEVLMNVTQLITSKGYPCEEHTVQTDDGFLLGVQRIPHGVNKNATGRRGTVFLQHGFLCSATNWVTNLANESLAFILADEGYDVWLGNSRGNTYSRRHVKYNPNCDKFWNWSWDEMAIYDIPAALNYVLTNTGQSSLHYVGHSQGTLQLFARLSYDHQLAKKVKVFFALGPITTVGNIVTALKFIKDFSNWELYLAFGKHDFFPNNLLLKILAETVCKIPETRFVCYDILFMIAGYDLSNLNKTRLPIYIAHTPAGTSVRDLVHYAQMIRSRKFQRYDYGSKAQNIKHYKQVEPPVYNVSKMITPTVVFWAQNDWLADPTDVKLLLPKIQNLLGSYEVDNWNHLDFIWGVDAANIVYDKILKIMKEHP